MNAQLLLDIQIFDWCDVSYVGIEERMHIVWDVMVVRTYISF